MKSRSRLLSQTWLLAAVIAAFAYPAYATPAGCLQLPAFPLNDADAKVTAPPFGDGVAPEFSNFVIDIQPAGGPNFAPTPPIPAGRYAGWCFDVSTAINASGNLYGGLLYSTCGDADGPNGFNQYLPNRPNVKQPNGVWKQINYLINHRRQSYAGFVPTPWEVQHAIWGLMGQQFLLPGYPSVRPAVVSSMVTTAQTNAAAWVPQCGDVVAVIYNVDVNWDANKPDVQLIFLEVPVYCLGDKVWNDANRDGKQDASEPGIPNVTVELYRCNGALVATTTTDANGNYIFNSLLAGEYYVKVIAPAGYAFTLQNNQGATPNNVDSDANSTTGVMACVTLGYTNGVLDNYTPIKEDLTWDAGLYLQDVTVGNFVWNDLNANGIQDAGEPGIPGVQLVLTGTTTLGAPVTMTTTTDANGGYLFTAAPGTYTVTITAPTGYVATITLQGTPATDSNASPSGTTPGTLLGGGSDLTIDFGFYQPVKIGNFVWNDANGNGVQDAGEPGIPGVELVLKSESTVIATTNTDANGAYLFTAPPGSYTVTITPPAGYVATATGKGTPETDSNSSPSNTTPVTLAGGGSDLTIDFGYYQPVQIGNFVWNDTNQDGIQDAGEPGISGITVTLNGTSGDGVSQMQSQQTNSNGQYLFSGLPPGTYTVTLGTLPNGYISSPTNAGGDAAKDSNPSPSGTTPATLPGGSSDLTIDFGIYQPTPPTPGMRMEKTAGASFVAPFVPVEYKYTVYNTGNVTLTNIKVTDDNGTPGYSADDIEIGTVSTLAAGQSVTLTKSIIPVVNMVAVVNGNTVPVGSLIVATLLNGDYKITYMQSFSVNDNTYGTGQIGWPGGNKKFAQLVTSDQLEFRLTNKSGAVVLDFKMDYLSADASFPSGYGSKGPLGGDGAMVVGSASNIVSWTTSIADNLNLAANLPYTQSLIVNSPTSLVGGNVVINTAQAPGGWDPINSYTVVVKASAFPDGIGSITIPSQHNSPSKLGVDEIHPTVKWNVVTNTATATSGTLTASATATVTVGTPPPPGATGKIGSLVWHDKDGDGLQDAGEPGIGGVTVQLKNSSGAVIATTYTDGDGEYLFTGLTAGTYTVVVATPSGYTATQKAAGGDRSIDSNGSPAAVTLATNSSVDLTIDFGFKSSSTSTSKALLTYTQGGWGSEPKGNNPGSLLAKRFSTLYGSAGVSIGSTYTLRFTSAKAVSIFLPQGGTAGVLNGSVINPSSSPAGVLAGQLLALKLNVDFSKAGFTATGLEGKKITSGPFAGKDVKYMLELANDVVGGKVSLQNGITLSNLNDALTAINENYDNGTTNKGYLY